MKREKIDKILTLLLVMQWAFVQIIAKFPSVVETYYSNGIYLYISKILRISLGWLPFSFGDLLYAMAIGYLLKSIYKTIRYRRFQFKKTFFKIGGVLSIVFFVFHFNWGLNYFREPLFNRLNFEKTAYTNQELIEFTNKLILKINSVQLSITHNDTLVVENPLSKSEIKKLAPSTYLDLQKKHPQFVYNSPSVKHSFFSLPLTYMGFAGYLNPFTNEAQVNSLIPKNTYLATTCHEIAHQTGIASEKEANFVGYLAATNSTNSYFNYSGYLMALRYCLNEIYRNDTVQFEVLKSNINKGVLKDIQQNQDFWISYQNWTEPIFKIFYDSYLKANQQQNGIKGYNKVVLLLINYHSTEEL